MFYKLICTVCNKETTEDITTSVCPSCAGALDVIYDKDYFKSHVNTYVLLKTGSPKVVKYMDFMPLKSRDNVITLDEGGTPLHLAKKVGKHYDLTNVFIKIEGLNPTGAFKDRGSFIEINKALELKYKAIVVASTGNMAASVAAFSVQAGLPCYVFVPDNTPRAKLAQSLSYGANVIQIRGTYSDAFDIAAKAAEEFGYYLAGDYAFRGEGQKTLAFELIEQSFFKPIDYVLVPIGMGTNIAAIWKGFKEYYDLGLIKKLPKIIGVQASGCSPVVDAFHNKTAIKPLAKPQTVSGAIAVGNPIDGGKALKAMIESNGMAISVTDDETLFSQQELAKMEGIYVEPASATTIAALKKLHERGTLKVDDRIICIATGAGLKDPATTLKILAEPPVIEPTIEEVNRVIKGNMFAIRASGMVDSEKELFTKVPEPETLVGVLESEFKLDKKSIDTDSVMAEIKEFLEKGKSISKADLQVIIETTMQQTSRTKYLNVIDFSITDTKHKRAHAWVKITLDGNETEGEGDGDGPVDAAINALRGQLETNGHIRFQLNDYNVEVASSGTDAATVVTMVLEDDKKNEVVVRETSPDIILASIDAFERGYNELVGRNK